LVGSLEKRLTRSRAVRIERIDRLFLRDAEDATSLLVTQFEFEGDGEVLGEPEGRVGNGRPSVRGCAQVSRSQASFLPARRQEAA
jgi:hypothetical protein